MLAHWKKIYDQPRQHIKKQRHYFANKGPYNQGYGFSNTHVWMWELDYKKSWMVKNWCFELWCWRRLLRVIWTARRSNQSILRKSVMNIHWKDWCWSWNSNTLATWCEELTPLKRPWCLERLKVGGDGDSRGWDGWMASPIQWIWVWVNSGCWWWTGKSGVLQFMRSQSVGPQLSDWTELNSLMWMVFIQSVEGLNRIKRLSKRKCLLLDCLEDGILVCSCVHTWTEI